MKDKKEELSVADFAQVVAHDLAAPLSQIALYADLLSADLAGVPDGKSSHYAVRIRDAAQRSLRLLESLHGMAKSGWTAEPMSDVALAEALGEAIADLDGRLKKTAAAVTVSDLPTVRARARQMYQLFSNLIDNAVKYGGPRAPQIHVSAERRNGDWVVTVADNGIGIAEEHWESVFEPFRRVDANRQRGLGIGLATCRRIVESHGGRVWVRSTPGDGAAFYFSLPA